MIRVVGPEVDPRLDWLDLTAALAAGHDLPKADLGDTFLQRGEDTLLCRAAIVRGLGALVKTATVFPGNAARAQPSVNGAACVFSDTDGTLEALVDFHLLTWWKTAGDSLLAAIRLAPPSVRNILIVGAGTVARSLCRAYPAAFPDARLTVWSRTARRAEELAAGCGGAEVRTDLAAAVSDADIVCSATMSTEPLICGSWLRPGQHLDLIGAFRKDMREADDEALKRSRIFVDSRETVVHIGELADPIARGVIGAEDVIADFYRLADFRRDAADITLFKNGGGAHLDLMTARYILSAAG